jgi:hypothetical protein
MQELPSPWRDFLNELDAALPETVSLHCVGGFVVSFFYGLPRPTGDIDYYTAIPANLDLEGFAGRGSPLEKKHKVYLQRVAVNNMPEDYDTRLTEMFPKLFKNLRLFAPDPYDLILSKLERNSGKDRDDAAYLFVKLGLLPGVLHDRFQKELRLNLAIPTREDLTLKLWIDIFNDEAKKLA